MTWHYVQMLAGIPGIKPDRMIARFVAKALDLPVNKIAPSFSVEMLTRVAKDLGMTATALGCVQQSGVRVGPDQRYRRVVAE